MTKSDMSDRSDSFDTEIICRVIGGDVNAFELLLKKYKNHVFSIVKKHIPCQHAEETVQDVFVTVYQSLHTFKGKSSFKRWLSAIATRTCYDFWRKTYKSHEIPMSALSEKQQDWIEEVMADDSVRSAAAKGRQKEAQEILEWALNRMSAKDRMVLELVYLEGMSGKEAARLLGWSVVNVKVRCHRARKKIEKLLVG
ncbi:RNA polymerase sigma factor [Desulfococcaceae bacterium HSG7]|nr:RNA polymerase sigma factor [Desulfococcaceae bacterium HSG7]